MFYKNIATFSRFIIIITNRQFSRRLNYILEKLDIPRIRFHDLRHSHASFLLYNDVSIDYVSKRLGHKNTRITLDVYAHMLKEKEQEQDQIAKTTPKLDVVFCLYNAL